MKCFTHEVERCDNPDCAPDPESLCMRPACVRGRIQRRALVVDAQAAVERSVRNKGDAVAKEILLWKAIAITAALLDAADRAEFAESVLCAMALDHGREVAAHRCVRPGGARECVLCDAAMGE